MRPIRKLDTRMCTGVKQLILPPGQNNKATENQVLKALAPALDSGRGPRRQSWEGVSVANA